MAEAVKETLNQVVEGVKDLAVSGEKKVEEKAETNGKAEETEMPDIPIPAAENGTSTPQQHGAENGQAAGAALESTPAFGEDLIR